MLAKWSHLHRIAPGQPGTLGEELARVRKRIDRIPEPLGSRFTDRFAVAVTTDPELFGRLFIFAGRAARRKAR